MSVGSTTIVAATFRKVLPLPTEYIEPRWYAVQTYANHDRRVLEQFDRALLEGYLPRYISVRRWKDRRVRLDLPFFPGCVFVLRDRLRLLQTPCVVRLVGFGGQPCPLADQDIDALRRFSQRYSVVGRRRDRRDGFGAASPMIAGWRRNAARLTASLC
jgi:transcription antitermination factor NusG